MTMMRFGLHFTDGDDIVATFNERALDIKFGTYEHGCLSLSFSVPMSVRMAFRYYNWSSVLGCKLLFGGLDVWDGRVEDLEVSGGKLNVVAFGRWSAMHDTLYNALWSDSSTASWMVLSDDDHSGYNNERFEMDNNRRLRFAPTKDEMFDNVSEIGAWAYEIPSGSSREIKVVSFDYKLYAPDTNWRARLRKGDDTWDPTFGAGSEWGLTTTGSVQTGSVTKTLSTTIDRVVFCLFYDNATAAQYTGETGDVYFTITNLRVTTDTGDITADKIAVDMLTHIAGINSDQLRTDDIFIDSPGLDLDQEIYVDARPAEVLNRLCGLGDNSTPSQRYEAGVWFDRYLHFRPLGDVARHWLVTLDLAVLERSLQQLYNAAYAKYDGGNRPARTAVAVDEDSVLIYGLERQAVVDVSTTSATKAAVYRDAFVADNSKAAVRAQIPITSLRDEYGAERFFWEPRGHDTVTVTNLPPTLVAVDDIRSFRIKQTECGLSAGQTVLTPLDLSTLEFLISRS